VAALREDYGQAGAGSAELTGAIVRSMAGEPMMRILSALALLAAMAGPVLADVPPQKGKCSTSEEHGAFMAAWALCAVTILAWRTLKRRRLGRA